jgi:NAD(P)H-hydrate epimerase
MSHSFSRILSSSQLRELEASWIKRAHKSWGLVLMEVAGLNAAQIAASLYDGQGGVTVFCGRGNNGGDGLVVARHLMRWQIPVSVFMVESGSKSAHPDSECAINKQILEASGLEVNHLSANDLEPARSAIARSGLVIDALLGTGLDRQVEGVYSEVINLINESSDTVLALDVPSGINSNSGQVMGVAVQASATVTFGHLKAGLLHYPGAEYAGAIELIDIGLPAEEPPAGPRWWLATYQQVADWLVPRVSDAHKGTFGRLLCIAGSSSMTGAAMLSARTSLRAGTGITVLATAKSVIGSLPAEEIIYRPVDATEFGTISPAALSDLEHESELSTALLIGPGLSSNVETIRFVQDFLRNVKQPCIVDADALNAIAQDKQFSLTAGEEVVFTPHPKELSRLLGIGVGEIQADRMTAAEKARDKFSCNIVLKGAHTVVATVTGDSYIIPCGNSGMATAGSGDVLSGIIGAFLAQGMPAHNAAVAGAYVHAAAGDLAAFTYGEDGMVASNIMESVPMVLADLRAHEFTGTELEQMVLSL